MIKTLGTNYYAYCCSTRAVTRLAHDFERDACLLIRDPVEFAHRLDRAVRNVLRDWRFIQAQVEYYDPLAVNEIIALGRDFDVNLNWALLGKGQPFQRKSQTSANKPKRDASRSRSGAVAVPPAKPSVA